MCQTLELTLQDIGKWISPISDDERRKKDVWSVAVPALQRGLVWRPKQIELLWDSVMRGIPVGSFVVCSYIDDQDVEIKGAASRWKYHLLDGQQRANAIQLGFDDFRNPRNKKNSVLWIDLDPREKLKGTTRKFLLRVTTTSHPWGYTRGDEEGYLSASDIRELLDAYGVNYKEETYVRPQPNELQPLEANVPVPLSIVINAFTVRDATDLLVYEGAPAIERLKISLRNSDAIWAHEALKRLQDKDCQKSVLQIGEGLKTALNTKILALRAPDDLMEESSQEIDDGMDSDVSGITNIEHLFARLNQQGTELEGEELTYSLIKSHWPKITTKIDRISESRMLASRAVMLAFRMILTEEQFNEKHKLVGWLSVSAIRRLAREGKSAVVRNRILEFITGNDIRSYCGCCDSVDHLLGVAEKDQLWGVPSVLRSSLAYNSPDVYLLLLLIARKFQNLGDEERKALAGMACLLHWFAIDQSEAVNFSYQKLISGVTATGVLAIERELQTQGFVKKIRHPKAIERFVQKSLEAVNLAEWDWWRLYCNDDLEEQERLSAEWQGCIESIRGNRELLLYAQRDMLKTHPLFRDYDPARKDLWESHNRPWDFDHIVARRFMANVKRGEHKYLWFCQRWRDTIGNLRAWPFEMNRSDQDTAALTKMINRKILDYSFVTEKELHRGFSCSRDVVESEDSARAFALTCLSRMMRIYKEWLDTFAIPSF